MAKDPALERPIGEWHKVAKHAEWKNLAEVHLQERLQGGHADRWRLAGQEHLDTHGPGVPKAGYVKTTERQVPVGKH